MPTASTPLPAPPPAARVACARSRSSTIRRWSGASLPTAGCRPSPAPSHPADPPGLAAPRARHPDRAALIAPLRRFRPRRFSHGAWDPPCPPPPRCHRSHPSGPPTHPLDHSITRSMHSRNRLGVHARGDAPALPARAGLGRLIERPPSAPRVSTPRLATGPRRASRSSRSLRARSWLPSSRRSANLRTSRGASSTVSPRTSAATSAALADRYQQQRTRATRETPQSCGRFVARCKNAACSGWPPRVVQEEPIWAATRRDHDGGTNLAQA
jgi:hypothetical protein